MKTTLTKFDILYLCEGCAIGSHLRQGIWARCIDEFFAKLSDDEREWLYTYAKRDLTHNFIREGSCGRGDYFKFLSRFNPANRYMVVVEGDVGGKHCKQIVDAFKWDRKFWIDSRHTVVEESVTHVDQVPFSKCCADFCVLRDTCARYSDNPSVMDRYINHLHEKCDMYIYKNMEHGVNLNQFER